MRDLIAFVLLMGGAALAGAGPRPLSPADVSAGKALYLRECSGCHGERGDGAGPAAAWIDPRPRDFTTGVFKFRTTASGQPPATADVLRVIERGVPGTAMPPFAFLPPDERKKIAAYVLRVADVLDEPEPEPLPAPGPPPPSTPERLAVGKQLWADIDCGSCHGASGKVDERSTKDLKNTDGTPTRTRDLTTEEFRGGSEPADVYYRLLGGLNGTPMPSFADALEGQDVWALIDYVRSLHAPTPPPPLPADPLEAGRVVTAKHFCRGCHVLDDGKGGDVGPDLRLSGRKLDPEWIRKFLTAPRQVGKIYPWRPARMPGIELVKEEVDALTQYLGVIGKRPAGAGKLPDVASFPAKRLEEGKNMFVLRCAQCHSLGKVVETPAASQQGPNLINVAKRVDFEWSREWIRDPKKWDQNTKMQVTDITPDQIDSVRMFVWKTSMAAAPEGAPAGGTP